jgi:hypothetical protein
MDVHTHNLRINLPHTLSLFTCADDQIKAGGYVRVKLTGLVHAYRLFTLLFDHVFDDDYDCMQDTEMSALLHLCMNNAKTSIFVWHAQGEGKGGWEGANTKGDQFAGDDDWGSGQLRGLYMNILVP